MHLSCCTNGHITTKQESINVHTIRLIIAIIPLDSESWYEIIILSANIVQITVKGASQKQIILHRHYYEGTVSLSTVLLCVQC